MKEPKRVLKNDIKYNIQLDENQKEAKRLVIENDIVTITGPAGSGKSLVCAQVALDFLFKNQVKKIYVCRALIELEDETMGFIPGDVKSKFGPYLEPFKENLEKCYDPKKIEELITTGKIIAGPPNFMRGKTIDDILIIEEGQNLNKGKMIALLTRLGKEGKIIINGDLAQTDKKFAYNGLEYCKFLSEKIPEIKYIKLTGQHRHDLVGKILRLEYETKQ